MTVNVWYGNLMLVSRLLGNLLVFILVSVFESFAGFDDM